MTAKGNSASLVEAIRDGSFPDSNDILSSELSSLTIPQLLDYISESRSELSDEISQVSQSLGGGVEDWIVQARKVQNDIKKCKEDARSIVEEHERVQKQQREAQELQQKTTLLQSEIDFTSSLQSQLQTISSISHTLKVIEQMLNEEKAAEAARALKETRDAFLRVKGPQVQKIVREVEADLTRRARLQLEHGLNATISVERNQQEYTLEFHDRVQSDLEPLLEGLASLNTVKQSMQALAARLEVVLVHPLRERTKSRWQSHTIQDNTLQLTFGQTKPQVQGLFNFIVDSWTFLLGHMPKVMVDHLATDLIPKAITTFMTDWLTPAIPTQFDELNRLDELQQQASQLAHFLEHHDWPGASQLSRWIEQAPRIWLAKRKAETLDAVRKSLTASKGVMHQVERVERQKAKAPSKAPSVAAQDDWNTSWNDQKEEKEDDEDASGWGFEDDDPPSPEKTRQNGNVAQTSVDEGDVWGWGDDEQAGDEKTSEPAKVNGAHTMEQPQEMVLTELYSITDIPDYLVEVIGRDIQDSIAMSEQEHESLREVGASKGLLGLPTFALAMFRATAPTHYSTSSSLGNMNLYNDASYIAEKLRGMNAPDMPSVASDCAAMDKFARSAYSKEMDTQRTVLTDLLDGAQGFEGCTQPMYAREIENAVASTADRVRQVYADWKPILSTSALLQSVGALVSSVIIKIIGDIEEMDEISAPQSEKLVGFCSQISALEDLFMARPPDSRDESESMPMTAVYVSNWLKFQYLINILDASLVDIRYLWTQGELSLEYTPDELIDLIEALFQESSHRRSAIAAIRGSRMSR